MLIRIDGLVLRPAEGVSSGKRRDNVTLAFLRRLSAVCPNLKVLHLEDCTFNYTSNIQLSDLPKTIEKLSLAGGWILS